MSTEGDIHTALKSLCGARVFPDFAPLSTARPYVTYAQIGGEALSRIGAGVHGLKHGRFQVNVWGDSRLQCSALMLQAEEALLSASGFQARAIGAMRSDYDPDMLTYSSMQDFSIYSPR